MMRALLTALTWTTLLLVPATAPDAQEPTIVEEEILDDASPGGDLTELERRAEELFADDDLEGALAIYRQLAASAASAEKKADALVLVAWIEHLSERDAAAFSALTEALVSHPDRRFRPELYTDEFRELYREAEAEALEKRDLAAYEASSRGLEHYRRRDYAAARQAFEEALGHRADHPQALYNLALVELYEKNYERALAGFQKIVALADRRPEEIGARMHGLALANVGYLYNRRQLYEEAEGALVEAVRLHPTNAAAWSNLGVSRRRLGKNVDAAAAFRRAHELDPDDPKVMNNLALTYIDTAEWVSAVALLKGATERFPNDANMWLNFGKAQLGMGHEAGALASFESAIAHDPGNAQGWAEAAAVQLAKYHLAKGDYTSVLATAQRILAWADSSPGWEYKGLAQWKTDDLEGARSSFERARRLDPSQAQTHQNLGAVYYELRLLAPAEEALERALAIDPNLAEAQANLTAVRALRAQQPTDSAALPPAQTQGRSPPRKPPPAPPPAPQRARLRLGLRFSDVDYAALGLTGVGVESVVPGTLASRADIRPMDLILRVDGHDVSSPEQLERYVLEADGPSVVLDLLRENLPQRIELRLD